jgi:hypothetical protein
MSKMFTFVRHRLPSNGMETIIRLLGMLDLTPRVAMYTYQQYAEQVSI